MENSLTVSPLYLAVLGLICIPMTMRVGLYRIKNKINLGDGDDAVLRRLIRGHANFIETVPLAALMILVMDFMGAGTSWLHALGAGLVAGRVLHYLGLTRLGPFVCRPIGMFATLSVYGVSGLWILVHSL